MPKTIRRQSAGIPPDRNPVAALPYRARFDATGGNGKVHSDVERLERLEALLQAMQQTLDTQFRRMATMQAELDHLKARQRGD